MASNIQYIIKDDMKSDTAAISGSSQINDDNLPVSNIIDDIVGRKWRTGNDKGYFRIFIGGPNQNDYIDWSDGTTRVVQLTEGHYTAVDLATEIETQIQTLTSNVSVSYSSSTNKFTISIPSGTLSLLSNTGANIENSIWNDIGYNTDTDNTSVLSYESDNKIIHMEEFSQIFFGTLTIRDATTTINSVAHNKNDKLNFKESSTGDELIITISPANYNIHDLMNEIKFQMESVGTNSYDVLYDEKTKKVTITTDGTYLDILWETGTNGYDNNQECWYLGLLLGLDDTAPTGSSDSTGSTSYSLDFPIFPEFSPQTIDISSIHGHTLSSSATIELYFRYAYDRFLFNNSLESVNNPDDVLNFTGDLTNSLVDEHDQGYSLRIGGASIVSQEAVGNPIIAGPVTVTSIASGEAFGIHTVVGNQQLLPGAISSGENFDIVIITGGA